MTATIGQVYKGKDKGDKSITTSKGYSVAVDKIYIEPGFNVRELDSEEALQSIAGFVNSYENSVYVPPVIVKRNDDTGLFQIIDGHHRFLAAQKAGVLRLSCDDYKGSAADEVTMMITSSQGRQLSSVERAMAYKRLAHFGYTNEEIAAKCNRSRADVANHLLLADADVEVIQAVRDETITMNEVNEVTRKQPIKATNIIKAAVTKAVTVADQINASKNFAGVPSPDVKKLPKKTKPKVKPSDLGKFTNTNFKRLIELTYNPDINSDDKGLMLEKDELVAAYLKSIEV
jgi:ParB family chromosome partitioning protein